MKLLFFENNFCQNFILVISTAIAMIIIKYTQLQDMKAVMIDLRRLYVFNYLVAFFSIMLFITYFRMLKELVGAIKKNMTMKSDFELILQSL